MIQIFNPETNVIHLDMDGVLADFDKFVLQNLGRTFDYKDREMWDFLSTVDHLYLQLEPTPYCHELVELARSFGRVEILTAIPRRATLATAEDDKIEWVKKHLGDDIQIKIGPFSRDKWKHARSGDILVDDRFDNIQDWINKGFGIGIFHMHNDYANTAERLTAMATEHKRF